MSPTLAVAIPCYEAAAFLPETLASLAAQTRRPDEVVIADDGSTGGAMRDLLGELQREGSRARQGLSVRVLREPHRGPGPTRNAAVLATGADLVLPLDDDDALAPTALQKLEAALLADPAADFSYCHVAYFGAVQGSAVPPRYNPYLQLDDNSLVVTALLRRDAFRRHGLRYAEMPGYEDWSFWLGAVERGLRGVCVEEPLFRYRRKRDGVLAQDHARREELKAELRRRHAALYSDESRAQLKRRFAPGVEVVSSDAGLRSFLDAQTLDDADLAPGPFADAADLLQRARGKFLLFAGDGPPPARPTLLEELVRRAEAHPQADAVSDGDLLLLRTARAAHLSRAHLPAGAPLRALAAPSVRHGRVLPLIPGAPGPAPAAPLWKRTALPLYRAARTAAERLAGEERLGKLLHPLKERALDLSWRLDALDWALRSGRVSLDLQPLLTPSARVEKRLLDAIAVRPPQRPDPSRGPLRNQ